MDTEKKEQKPTWVKPAFQVEPLKEALSSGSLIGGDSAVCS